MVTVEEYKQQVREMMSGHIRRHSVAIWQEVSRDEVYIGSGVCIQIADRLFVATAAHNFKVILKGGSITPFSTSSNTPLTVIAQNPGEYGKYGTLDLGWLEIDHESAAANGLEGLPLSWTIPYHEQKPDDHFHVAGFRAAGAKRRSEDPRDVAVPIVIYNTISNVSAGGSDDRLLVSYGPAANTDQGLEVQPHPKGISGGGMWFIPPLDTSKKILSPADRPLVGVAIDYFKKNHEISGLRLYHWLKLIRDDHAELQEEIAPLLDNATQS
jgi:hypothetical protein